MLRKNLLLWGLLFFAGYSFSQTYQFSYKCLYNSREAQNSQPVKNNNDSAFRELGPLLFGEVRIIYEIVSNGQYMIISGRMDSIHARKMKVDISQEDAVIDIRNKLIYFPNEERTKKVKIFSLYSDSSEGECMIKFLREVSPKIKVELCKKIPPVIYPPVLFEDAKYGVQSMHAPGLTVELVSFKKINADKRLRSCKSYFDLKTKPESEYDFFYQ